MKFPFLASEYVLHPPYIPLESSQLTYIGLQNVCNVFIVFMTISHVFEPNVLI